jgi:hypothetical protein
MKLECLRCRHTWKQAVPRWDRGHLLMKRGNKTVFVADDLGYEFGESIEAVAGPLLRTIGFADFGAEVCTHCGYDNARVVRGLLAPFTYGSEDLACAFLLNEDFINVGATWQLRAEAIEALTRSQDK